MDLLKIALFPSLDGMENGVFHWLHQKLLVIGIQSLASLMDGIWELCLQAGMENKFLVVD